MEAEIGVVFLPTKDHHRLPANHQNLGETWNRSLPHNSQKEPTPRTHRLQTLSPQNCETISAAETPESVGLRYGSPTKRIHFQGNRSRPQEHAPGPSVGKDGSLCCGSRNWGELGAGQTGNQQLDSDCQLVLIQRKKSEIRYYVYPKHIKIMRGLRVKVLVGLRTTFLAANRSDKGEDTISLVSQTCPAAGFSPGLKYCWECEYLQLEW